MAGRRDRPVRVGEPGGGPGGGGGVGGEGGGGGGMRVKQIVR